MYVLIYYKGVDIEGYLEDGYIQVNVLPLVDGTSEVAASLSESKDKGFEQVGIYYPKTKLSELDDVVTFFERVLLFKLFPECVPTFDYDVIEYWRY